MNQPGTAQLPAAVAAAAVRLCPYNFGGQKWPVVWLAIKMSFIARTLTPNRTPCLPIPPARGGNRVVASLTLKNTKNQITPCKAY